MIRELMIAAFTPSFLQKEVLWFEENVEKIRKISKSNAFWKKNVLFLDNSILKRNMLIYALRTAGEDWERLTWKKKG